MATESVTCTLVRTTTDLEALVPAWHELLEASDRPEPMLSPAWLLNWWRVYGVGRELAVAAYYSGDRLIGLAPMCRLTHRYRPGISFRRLAWLGADFDTPDGVCSDYLHLIVRKSHEIAVCRAFVHDMKTDALGAWDEWILHASDGEHPLTPILQDAWKQAGFSVETIQTSECPYLKLATSWGDYLKALPKKRRQSLTYAERDFKEWSGGEAIFHKAVDAASLVEGQRILQALHQERWQAEGNAGAFASPRFLAFHEAFMAESLDEGRLEMHWLSLRGQALAVHYSFRQNEKIYYYQTGRILDVPSNIRLGIVLLIESLRDAMQRGLTEFDFLAGQATYKSLFTTTNRSLVELRVAKPGLREWLLRGAKWGRSRVRDVRAWLGRKP